MAYVEFCTLSVSNYSSSLSIVLADEKPLLSYLEDAKGVVVGGREAPEHAWPAQVNTEDHNTVTKIKKKKVYRTQI